MNVIKTYRHSDGQILTEIGTANTSVSRPATEAERAAFLATVAPDVVDVPAEPVEPDAAPAVQPETAVALLISPPIPTPDDDDGAF